MTLQVSAAIRLRPIALKDSTIIYQTIARQREYLGQWLPFVEQTKTEQDTVAFIESTIASQKVNKEPFFVIEYEEQFCGIINCKSSDTLHKKTEIGYWLSKDFQKKGIMTLALKAMTEHVFTAFDKNRIVIKCASENYPSQNVAKRAGYYFEGIEHHGERTGHDKYRDLQVYSLLQREFTTNQPNNRTKSGINHIEFWVSDLAVSVPFYKGILELIGWQQVGAYAFATATTEIYLKEMPRLTKSNSLGVRHLCFQASKTLQVDKVAAFLKTKDTPIIRGPIVMNYSEGYYTIDFFDPDGIIIEVAHTPQMKFLP